MSPFKILGTIGRMWARDLPPYFSDSLLNMTIFNQIYLCGYREIIWPVKASVSWHESARNELVDKMKGDWILMLDTDHTFAPDLLSRLLGLMKRYDAKVISGIYQYKFPPHAPVVNAWTPEGRLVPILDWDREAEILEIGAIGAGNLLVRREVFDAIRKKFNCNPFDIIQGLSEDYSFFWRCKELGIPCYLAPKVECHHVIGHVLSVEDYKPWEEIRKVEAEGGKII